MLGAALWFGRRSAFVVAGIAIGAAAIAELIDGMVDLSMTAVHIALLALTAHVVGGLADRARDRRGRAPEPPPAPGRARPAQAAAATADRRREPLCPGAGRRVRGLLPGGRGAQRRGDRRDRRRGREGDGSGAAVDLRARDRRGLRALCRRPGDDREDRQRRARPPARRVGAVHHDAVRRRAPRRHHELGVGRSPAAGRPGRRRADRRRLAPAIRSASPPRSPTSRSPTPRSPPAGILLYTDGLSDARPPGRKFQPFGEARIRALLRELDAPTPEHAVERLAHAAQVFSGGPLPDDLCVVAAALALRPRAGTTISDRTAPRRPRPRAPRARSG